MSEDVFKLNNGTVFLVVEAPGGVYNAAQLKLIGDICSQDLGIVKATEDQRIGLFIKEENLSSVQSSLQDGGLGFRHYQKGLHQATTCLGELCPDHEQDALGVVMELSSVLSQEHCNTPLKIGVNGCFQCCNPCHTMDISIVGESSGYKISLGGKTQQLPELASFMAEGVPAEKLPSLILSVIEVYMKHVQDDERLLDVIERCGSGEFVSALAPYSQDAADDSDPFAAPIVSIEEAEDEGDAPDEQSEGVDLISSDEEASSDLDGFELDQNSETDELETDDLETDDLEADDLEADDLETDDLETDELEADEVATDDLEVDDLEIDEVATDDLEVDDLEVDEVEVDEVEVDEVEVDEVEVDEVEVGDLDLEDIEDEVEADDLDLEADGELAELSEDISVESGSSPVEDVSADEVFGVDGESQDQEESQDSEVVADSDPDFDEVEDMEEGDEEDFESKLIADIDEEASIMASAPEDGNADERDAALDSLEAVDDIDDDHSLRVISESEDETVDLHLEEDSVMDNEPAQVQSLPSTKVGAGNLFKFSSLDFVDSKLRLNFESSAYIEFDVHQISKDVEQRFSLGGQDFALSKDEDGINLEVDGVRLFFPLDAIPQAS